MKVLRRVRRMYRCRFFLRFTVLIGTALLCGLEVVKYKDRLQHSGLPYSSRDTKNNPPIGEQHRHQHHEIENSRVPLSEGLSEDYGKHALEDKDDILDTRIDDDDDDVTLEEDNRNEENEVDESFQEDEEDLDSVARNNQESWQEPINESEEDETDEKTVNNLKLQNEKMEIEEEESELAEKLVEQGVNNEKHSIESKEQTTAAEEDKIAKGASDKELKQVNKGDTKLVDSVMVNDEESRDEENEDLSDSKDQLYFNEIDVEKFKDEEGVEEEADKEDEREILGVEGEETNQEKGNNHKLLVIDKPEVIKEAQSQTKRLKDKQREGVSRNGHHLKDDKGNIGNNAEERLIDNDQESEFAEENVENSDAHSTMTYRNIAEVDKYKHKEITDLKRMNESGFSEAGLNKNENGNYGNAGLQGVTKFNDSLRLIKHFEETGENSITKTEKHVKEINVNLTNERSKESNTKAKGVEHFKETKFEVKSILGSDVVVKQADNGNEADSTKGRETESADRNGHGYVEIARKEKLENNKVDGSETEKPATSEDVSRRQDDRKQILKTFCQNHPKDRNLPPKRDMGHLVVLDEAKIIYCSIPKVASTEWREALAVYHHHERVQGKQAQNRTLWKHLNEYSSRNVTEIIPGYYKFLFVREPFERLLSAYKSKFLAKNKVYHRMFGREIIKKFRENATEHAKQSGDDVTFLEFVKHVASAKIYEEHWRPYYQLCHVCSMDYNFIGHLETIDEDAPFLVKEARIDDRVTFKSRRRSRTSSDLLSYYSDIPDLYIQRLRRIYFRDFEMFGYPFPGPLKSLVKPEVVFKHK